MKGLLIKDFYVLFRQVKIITVLVIVLSIMPGFSATAMAQVYVAMLPITALAYDERAKWGNLAAMMPYTLNEITFSKYLIGYIAMAAVFGLSIVSQFVIGLITHSPVGTEQIAAMLITCCVAAILMAVNLPIMFRLGVEKGRIFFYVLIGICVVASILMSDWLAAVFSSADSNMGAMIGVAAGATVLINVISVAISPAMYKKKLAEA